MSITLLLHGDSQTFSLDGLEVPDHFPDGLEDGMGGVFSWSSYVQDLTQLLD